MPEIVFALGQRADFFRINVEADDGVTGGGKSPREGEAYIAQADDAYRIHEKKPSRSKFSVARCDASSGYHELPA